MAANQLLGLHRQQVAVEHGRRLDEGLGQGNRWQLKRETTRLQYATFDVLHPLLEVGVAGVDVRPGVDDRNHGFARPVFGAVAHLHRA